ncbi:hypothetical protein [Agaribacterium haliotis]|uniref:hypothetical protein n=1 Tax=Agaribacterium haliotis TaxID=2013869 RepID=UPI000BB5368B|nr:hypothetical protein [Agaribacterium haliotis]
MQTHPFIVALALPLILCVMHSSNAEDNSLREVRIAASGNIASEFNLLSKKKRCGDDKLLDKHNFTRGTIELVLICRALKAAGSRALLHVVPSPNYGRALRMTEIGEVDMSAETAWIFDIHEDLLHKSNELIAWGGFEKGLYTRLDHPLLNTPIDKLDISQYRGVTIRGWHSDWQALSAITAQIYSATRHDSPFKMLEAGRADFILMNFSNRKDLAVVRADVKMKPIPGVKVKLPGARHYVTSRQSSKGKKLQNLLNLGLEKLKQNGELQRLLTHAGVNIKQTRDWKILNKTSFEQAKKLHLRHQERLDKKAEQNQ